MKNQRIPEHEMNFTKTAGEAIEQVLPAAAKKAKESKQGNAPKEK